LAPQREGARLADPVVLIPSALAQACQSDTLLTEAIHEAIARRRRGHDFAVDRRRTTPAGHVRLEHPARAAANAAAIKNASWFVPLSGYAEEKSKKRIVPESRVQFRDRGIEREKDRYPNLNSYKSMPGEVLSYIY